MKRHIYILAALLVCVLVLAGCQCRHEWQDANCTDPETCGLCGVTQGDPAGHTWKAASCNAPKTCETCGTTEGKVLDHTWVDATCAAPKTCTACGLTEGEALPHTWVDADCENPKTCSVCSATEGAPFGHTWKAATCEDPKTCEACEKTEGDALGHTWVDATCETPKTCKTCKLTEGEALGHKWVDATTEAPKTCSVCKATEGSAIKTDSRFKTSACKPLFGSWKNAAVITAEEMGITGYDGEIVEYTAITFKNDGTMIMESGIEDYDAYICLFEYSMIQELYAEYAARGMSKEQADSTMHAQFGVTVEEYASEVAGSIRESDLTYSETCVYYVAGNQLYGGTNWDEEMIPVTFSIRNGKLILTDEEYGETMEFTRV